MNASRAVRICAIVALLAALALLAYSWHAFGAIDDQHLLAFHGQYLTYLALPLALAFAASAFLVRRDSAAFIAFVVFFAITTLFVAFNLVRLFAYMIRMSRGL